MRVYYGWVIVAVGIVVSCIGVGTMMSLAVSPARPGHGCG
jgi:Na+-transporting NADH:ubiquinone oxidoreductase subunit NqrD